MTQIRLSGKRQTNIFHKKICIDFTKEAGSPLGHEGHDFSYSDEISFIHPLNLPNIINNVIFSTMARGVRTTENILWNCPVSRKT